MLKFDDKNEEAFKKMLRILKFKHRKNIMVSQLDKEIEAGLAPGKDPTKLIELKTLRLNFLNIGPNI